MAQKVQGSLFCTPGQGWRRKAACPAPKGWHTRREAAGPCQAPARALAPPPSPYAQLNTLPGPPELAAMQALLGAWGGLGLPEPPGKPHCLGATARSRPQQAATAPHLPVGGVLAEVNILCSPERHLHRAANKSQSANGTACMAMSGERETLPQFSEACKAPGCGLCR